MSEMEYRRLPRGGEELSVIGLGTGFNEFPGREEMAETVRTALDAGINLLDLTPWDARAFVAFGDALKGRRGEAHLQMHFGSGYGSGTYERVEGLEAIRRSVEWQMNQLGTDYIDFGFIHCVDDPGLLDRMHADGTIDHILRLRDEGTVRHVALSTHTPAIAQRVLDEGIVDLIMFSIILVVECLIGILKTAVYIESQRYMVIPEALPVKEVELIIQHHIFKRETGIVIIEEPAVIRMLSQLPYVKTVVQPECKFG